MVKLTLLYAHPEDASAFDDYYLNTHLPIVRRIPGLRQVEVAVVTSVRGGAELPYHLVSELWYDSTEAMSQASASPEGQAAAADVANFPGHTGAVALVTEIVS